MNPTIEELLQAYYGCDSEALEELAERLDPVLGRIAHEILRVRRGSAVQALGEWDIGERLTSVWAHIVGTKLASLATWPHKRLSALTWIVHLLCQEMDRHLTLRGPF
jgi:hypothetical protein